MAKKQITQARWECTDEGILTGLFPGDVKAEFDLTLIFVGWTDMSEPEKFFAAYGFKQKCMDYSADKKWTYQDKADRALQLYDYIVENGKMPKSKKGGGFDLKKQVAKAVEKADVPLTDEELAVLKKLGLM